MPSVTFTAAQPVIRQALAPPTGASAIIVHFTVTPPPGTPANVRLVHLRTRDSVPHPNLPAEGRLPRESEVAELIVRNGTLTAGFSGLGGKNAKHPVVHMGGVPPGTFPVTISVPFTGRGAVVAAGSLVAESDTDIAPGGKALELLVGMAPIVGADLQPPVGWTVAWDDAAVEWPGAAQVGPSGIQLPQPPSSPSAPPALPPAPVPVPTIGTGDVSVPPQAPPGGLPSASPGSDPRAAAIALALQLLLPQLPPQQAAAIQAVLPALLSGGPVNRQTAILALLPLLLGGK